MPLVWAFVAGIALAPGAAGQTPAAAPPPQDSQVLRVSVDLVQIDATVTDARGRHVTDLTADDFEVLQDGRPQKLSTFAFVTAESPEAGESRAARSPGAPAPGQAQRTLAIVVDDLGLSIGTVARVRTALRRFIDEQIRPGDLVAILRTGTGIGALQGFTTDRRALHAAADRVRYNFRSRTMSVQAPNSPEAFLDEVFTAGTLGAVHHVVRGMAELPGRKSLVLVSDGFSLRDGDARFGRLLSAVGTVVDAANRASVVVHTMHASGLSAEGYGASEHRPNYTRSRGVVRAAQEGLGVLAEDTGGLFIRDQNDLNDGLARVLEDARGYYLLGYVPDRESFSATKPRFHALTVRVKRPGLRVRSRRGFVAPPGGAPVTAPGDRMLHALLSPFAGGGIRLRLSSFFGVVEKTGPVMQSYMHVDVRDLTFDEGPDGTRTAQIETLAMSFGDNGEPADRDERRYTVTLAPDRYQRALERGFVYALRMPVKQPGPYQLRIALRDVKSDRIGSASTFVEVPDIRKGHLTLSGVLVQGVPAAGGVAGAEPEQDPNATVAVRSFRGGSVVSYVCYVYNARRGERGQTRLESEVRLLRDGVEVFRGAARAGPASADNPDEIVAAGVLQLGARTRPGSYLLEITVTDRLAKRGARATQTIDFEVVD